MAYTSVSAVDLVTDTCILALPMKLVFSLRINIGHKIALAGIFGFGVMYVSQPPTPGPSPLTKRTLLEP